MDANTPSDDLERMLRDLARLEIHFHEWEPERRKAVEAYRDAIDALHKSALRRILAAAKADPAAMPAMRGAAEDAVVHAVLRYHELIKPSLGDRVEAALASVRPMLASHGGDVELLSVAPPAVEVRFTGACEGCAASTLTFHAGVRKAIEQTCPEITEVTLVPGSGGAFGFQSPFAAAAEGDWLAAGSVRDIPEDGIAVRALAGERVILFRSGEAVSCFRDACAHMGAEIHDGPVEGGVITCPRHGFRYDLRTGACLTAGDVRLQSHVVRLIDGRVEVRLVR